MRELPEGFSQWAEANRERIAAAEQRDTLPYFVKDNRAAFGLEAQKKTPLDIAKERHAKRTKAQEEEIRKRWEERKTALKEESSSHKTAAQRKQREEARKALEQWWKRNLPETKVGKFKAKRFEVTLESGQVAIINKNYYNEVATHYKEDEFYLERLKVAMKAHLIIPKSKFSHIEQPRHHQGVVEAFDVYRAKVSGVVYEFKFKQQQDGYYLYFSQRKKR